MIAFAEASMLHHFSGEGVGWKPSGRVAMSIFSGTTIKVGSVSWWYICRTSGLNNLIIPLHGSPALGPHAYSGSVYPQGL